MYALLSGAATAASAAPNSSFTSSILQANHPNECQLKVSNYFWIKRSDLEPLQLPNNDECQSWQPRGKPCGAISLNGHWANIRSIDAGDGHDACNLCNCDLVFFSLVSDSQNAIAAAGLKVGDAVDVVYTTTSSRDPGQGGEHPHGLNLLFGAMGWGWNAMLFGALLVLLWTCTGIAINALFLKKRSLSIRSDRRANCIVPLAELWLELPRLCLDGVLFTFSCGKRRPSRTRGTGWSCSGFTTAADSTAFRGVVGRGEDEVLDPQAQVARNLAKLYKTKQRESHQQADCDYGAV